MAVYAQPGSSDAQPLPVDSDAGSSSSGKGKKRKHAAVSASAAAASSPSRGSGLVRYLYFKPQQSNASAAAEEDDVKPGCTLFVVNVPPFYTAEHLTQLFTCFGAVENVNFLQTGAAATLSTQLDRVGAVQPSSFYRSAHVVYEEEQSVSMARTTDLSRMPQPCPAEEDDGERRGVRSWIAAYHAAHPDVQALQMQVDRFMEGFDARTAAERAAARSGAAQQTDAEGWTLVRSTQRGGGSKKALMAREEETERAAQRAAKKARQNTVVHFYKHHEREQKKERLVQLREKFEQDKLKIAALRQERKFKPY
jgi:ribosomal RNA-processing protein 7